MRRLPRPARRALLVVHVTASAGWLGLTLGLLALAVAGAAGGSAGTDAVAYRAMAVFTDWLVVPVALLTLGSGLVLSLGTHWGLARHRWVYTKFWLTLVTTAASAFSLRPTVGAAAAEAAAGRPVAAADLLVPPSVALTTYVFITAISVLKPWGPTRRGRRPRAAERTGGDAREARGDVNRWTPRRPLGQAEHP